MNNINTWDGSQGQQEPIYLKRVFIPGGLANPMQQQYFRDFVKDILETTRELSHQEKVMKSLRDLEWSYGSRGIGFGRSVQSILTMGAIDAQRCEAYHLSHTCFAVLIAMHYDINYMKAHDWLDITFGDAFPYLALSEIANLTHIGLLMGVNQLPKVSKERIEHVLHLAINSFHEPQQLSLEL